MMDDFQTKRIELNIRRKVLWPLSLLIVCSLAIFLFVSHYYLEVGLNRTQETKLQSLIGHYQKYVHERTGVMRSLLQQLGRDQGLVKALQRRDRVALLEHTSPLYNELRDEQNITHFYFHAPDGENLLRLHKPERYGDQIDRVTMHQAQHDNKISDGLELGPLGTFTLRVVMPVHSRGLLVGYIELGEDIDPILDHLAEDSGAHMTILIQKKFLNREAWIEGRNMLGKGDTWELLPDHVVGGVAGLDILKMLPQLVSPEALNRSETVELVNNEKTYRGRFLNMMDAAGSSVGSLLVLQDITAILQDYTSSIWLISLFCFSLAAVMFFVASVILGRADASMKMLKKQLIRNSPEP